MSVPNEKRKSKYLHRLISFKSSDIARAFNSLWEINRTYANQTGRGDEMIINEPSTYIVSKGDSYITVNDDATITMPESVDRHYLVVFVKNTGETAVTLGRASGVTIAGKSNDVPLTAGKVVTLRYMAENKDWAILSVV